MSKTLITEKTLMNIFSWFVVAAFLIIVPIFVRDNKKWEKKAKETKEWRKTIKKGDTTDILIPQYVISTVVVDSVYNDTVLVHLSTEKNYLYKK